MYDEAVQAYYTPHVTLKRDYQEGREGNRREEGQRRDYGINESMMRDKAQNVAHSVRTNEIDARSVKDRRWQKLKKDLF